MKMYKNGLMYSHVFAVQELSKLLQKVSFPQKSKQSSESQKTAASINNTVQNTKTNDLDLNIDEGSSKIESDRDRPISSLKEDKSADSIIKTEKNEFDLQGSELGRLSHIEDKRSFMSSFGASLSPFIRDEINIIKEIDNDNSELEPTFVQNSPMKQLRNSNRIPSETKFGNLSDFIKNDEDEKENIYSDESNKITVTISKPVHRISNLGDRSKSLIQNSEFISKINSDKDSNFCFDVSAMNNNPKDFLNLKPPDKLSIVKSTMSQTFDFPKNNETHQKYSLFGTQNTRTLQREIEAVKNSNFSNKDDEGEFEGFYSDESDVDPLLSTMNPVISNINHLNNLDLSKTEIASQDEDEVAQCLKETKNLCYSEDERVLETMKQLNNHNQTDPHLLKEYENLENKFHKQPTTEQLLKDFWIEDQENVNNVDTRKRTSSRTNGSDDFDNIPNFIADLF